MSKILEITLPKTLARIGDNVFSKCDSLKTVYLEKGFDVLLSDAGLSHFTRVGPLPTQTIYGVTVWDLR